LKLALFFFNFTLKTENPFEIILEKWDSIEKAIEKLNIAPQSEEDFMTLEQVSLFIGLAKTSVYGLVHKGQIPHSKLVNDCILKNLRL
jgi:uncharacterized protein (UPF0218 family)